jgi:excisionase family DNA binding protein
MRLEELIERGLDDAAIGRRLGGRSANAVKLARHSHGVRSRSASLLSARAVARLLGKACSKSVARWIELGLLEGRRGQRWGANRQWYVTEDALLAFLANPASWPAWEPSGITEAALREWATEIRRERYLTPGEVAAQLGVTANAVGAWVRTGRLRAVRYGNWWIPESALAGFEPPYARSRKGMRHVPFALDEVRRLVELRRAGKSFAAIAVELRRPLGSIANRWYRERVAS